jgi:hypothetical protein
MDHEERLKAALADRYLIEREVGCGGMAIQESVLRSPFCQAAAGVPDLCLPDMLPGS